MTAVAILGPGGIGGLLAVRLGQAGHEVTLIGRHPDRVTAAGLTLTAPGEDPITTTPVSRPYLTGPVDVADGTIEQVFPSARITVATPPGSPAAAATAELLEVPGLQVAAGPGEAQVLWQKLTFLATYALLTTAAGQPIGPARERFAEWISPLTREACAAAAVQGARIDPAAVEAQIRALPGEGRSSMLKDRLAGHELELDAIAGPTLRALGPSGAPVTVRAVQTILDAR